MLESRGSSVRQQSQASITNMLAVSVTLMFALDWACLVRGNTLVDPAILSPPEQYDQRPIPLHRTIRRLVGGHLKIKPKEYGDPTKNSFTFDTKGDSSYGSIWDDGMLISSAGDGDQKKKTKDDDEDKKTLSDQVAEGKYGLIQNELFHKNQKRPGIISYGSVADTKDEDNVHTLGGLKKDDIWLSEGHLLVLKGGSYPEIENTNDDKSQWPPIDDYEAPRRQVKVPLKPKVPPPFPVQLTDNGPLVFLTPNGSIPAPPFLAYPPPREGDGPFPPSQVTYPQGAPFSAGFNQGNIPPGGAPFPNAPYPYAGPGNASDDVSLPPFPFPINGTIADGFPPGAAFLPPPPENMTDLYDEDDQSIYYPPPYNFSYNGDSGKISPGPLVPGIVLPPPPDFFAPLEDNITQSAPRPSTTTIKPRPTKRPQSEVQRRPSKPKNTTYKNIVDIVTTKAQVQDITDTPSPPTTTFVQIPKQKPVKVYYYSDTPTSKPLPVDKPISKTKLKAVAKAPGYPVSVFYKQNIPTTSNKPYIVYDVPDKARYGKQYISTTPAPIPIRSYYSQPQTIEVINQKLEPIYSKKNENDNTVASYYFYEETPKTTTAPVLENKPFYQNIPLYNQQIYNQNVESGFVPSIDYRYKPLGQPESILIWPQKQGSRTLTEEYFTVQKPRNQQYVKPSPNFYQQLADIHQTIDFYSSNRPRQYVKPHVYKPKNVSPRPVYQFSFQAGGRQDAITFKAPKPDTEPFRPMVSYSKPYNLQHEYNTVTPSVTPASQQYLVEKVMVTTEKPTPTKYYPANIPKDEDYVDSAHYEQPTERVNKVPSTTVRPAILENVTPFPVTPNPLEHTYFTQQDERYFDDITRNYFTIFGKKIENEREAERLASTPRTPLEISPVRNPIDNGININYEQETYRNPPTLEHDTLVNYQNPRPEINPDAEFIPINTGGYRPESYPHQIVENKQVYTGEQDDLLSAPPAPSLLHDTDVNYKSPRPLRLNPDAEVVGAGQGGSFVSYRLPGDGAHVYFLTPAARSRQARL